jgi:hypothetical protein
VDRYSLKLGGELVLVGLGSAEWVGSVGVGWTQSAWNGLVSVVWSGFGWTGLGWVGSPRLGEARVEMSSVAAWLAIWDTGSAGAPGRGLGLGLPLLLGDGARAGLSQRPCLRLELGLAWVPHEPGLWLCVGLDVSGEWAGS